MHRRVGVTLAILALLGVTGCSALPVDGADTVSETLTPVPVADEGATPAAPARVSPPAGVTADGVVEADRLVGAHRTALAGRSYRWQVWYRVTDRDEAIVTENYTREVAVEGDELLVEQTSTKPPARESLYVSDGVGYLRSTRDGEATFERLEEPPGERGWVFADHLVNRFLDGLSVSVSEQEHDGVTYTRLHAAGGQLPDGLHDIGTNVWNYSATAYLTERGLVRVLVVAYDWGRGAGTRHVALRYEFTTLDGVTVTSPDWVSAVPSPTPRGDGAPAETTESRATDPQTATGG